MKKHGLQWQIDANGNHVADWNYKRYLIDAKFETLPMGFGRLYFLRFDGNSLGGAGSIEQCKSMAWRHSVNGKL